MWKILVIVGTLLLILVVLLFKKKSIKDEKPNYKILFIVGITWMPLGIMTKNLGFLIG